MVIIWTVTDTNSFPQKLAKARLSPPGEKRENERETREREGQVLLMSWIYVNWLLVW